MQKITNYILLVEDSPTDADIIRRVFLRAGKKEWRMLHVERLSEAIDACSADSSLISSDDKTESRSQRRFNVVLLDLFLPDYTGLETVKEFRAAVPDIPVVVLTGLDDEELALQAMAEGAQDYLIKDQITIQRLMRAIRYSIERGQVLNKLRESEEAVRQALAKEQELNQIKSKFVAMISHEFRSPITAIQTAADILLHHKDKLTEERRAKYFERIQDAIKNMLRLLDEVLFLSRAEAGKLQYNPVPLNIEIFCLEITEMFQISADNQCNIIFNYQGRCTQVEMDEDLLISILTNLISNAIKYSFKQSNVRFYLTCNDDIATFRVQDQGIGIPLKDQPHLFESFYRASNVSGVEGTGLGLCIVKKCVDLHGGQIQVESQEGVGTTVIVELPIHFVEK